ncbi:MAG TPA: hypothetical protein VF039_07880 [Longimicrobiales bacterium]
MSATADAAARDVDWFVLHEPGDATAPWLAQQLAARLGARVDAVATTELLDARLVHHIGGDGIATSFALRDGRRLDHRSVRGGVIRAVRVPRAFLRRFAEDDREYVQQEAFAVLVAALHALTPNLLNPPDALGLAGRWRYADEWARLAAAAGLPVEPRTDAAPPAPSRVGTHRPAEARACVVAGRVLADDALPRRLLGACAQLGRAAATPFLELFFVEATRGWCLRGATPLPDPRAHGDALLDAVASALLEGAA